MTITALGEVRRLLGGDTFPNCESASLRLEKLVRLGGNSKKEEIDAVVAKPQRKIPQIAPKGALSFAAALGGRLIINQAGGILENAGICLHPHFNAPYVPGSALKGAARHAAWEAWQDCASATEKADLAQEIAEIFGYPTNERSLDADLAAMGLSSARAGNVCFLPAVPESTARIVTDIVNCHHPKYYTGNEYFTDAADSELPVPNFFPAVERNARFVFTILPLRGRSDLLPKAQKWLVKAIAENGIGAKTAAGYGWFAYDEAAEAAARARREREAAAEAEKKAREEAEAKAQAAARAKAEARANMTILEKWQELNKKAICNGPQIKGFFDLNDNVKIEIVRLLQMPEGIGREVWEALNRDKKLKNIPVAEAIRKFCKDHRDANGNKDLGKMPQ